MIVISDRDEIDVSVDASIEHVSSLIRPSIKILRMPDGSMEPTFESIETLKKCTQTGLTGVISSIIHGTCKNAERLGPGCSMMLVQLAQKVTSELKEARIEGRHTFGSINDQMRQMNELIEDVYERSMPLSQEGMKRMIKAFVHDDDLISMMIEAIELAGRECRIITSVTQGISSVERIEGYTFEIAPDAMFYDDSGWIRSNVSCLIVDGIIENISEIDQLLQRCHETRCSMVIFCRGFNDDVLNTLRVNFARSTLDVMPIRVPFDLQNANVLNDLAVCIGTDVASSLKGDLISTFRLDDLPKVDRINCRGSMFTLENKMTRQGVERHLELLREKRSEVRFGDVARVLDERMKSLSSNTIMLRLSAKTTMEGVRSLQSINRALETISTAIKHGCVDVSFLGLDESVQTYVSVPTALVGIRSGYALGQALSSVGHVLLADVT